MSEAITRTTQLPEITEPPVEEIEEEIEYRRPRDYREKSFEDQICKTLDSSSLQYERQKRVQNGIIDIFVYYQVPWIIEVKRSGSPFYLVQAIAQLKFYAACFKDSILFVAVPGGVPARHIPILHSFGIHELKIVIDENGNRRWDYG